MKSTRKRPDLRILIASTPRTGNTWVKLLLSEIYDLPIVSLPPSFDEARFEILGRRWIGHQHYFPTPELIAWARKNHVRLLTAIRHPADTLVSLLHYIRDQSPPPPSLARTASLLALDGDEIGPRAVGFVAGEFFSTLDISVYWMLARASLIVRYEKLWFDPIGTLTTLTSQIHSAPRYRIKRAVARCDFDNLRKRFDPEAKFFRSGRIGEGYQVLPPAILDILRSNEPYVSQFAILGYALDPADRSSETVLEARPTMDPFRGRKDFDNGIPIPYIAIELYNFIENSFKRWPHPLVTDGTNTFLGWLNEPAENDPSGQALPLITNLAAYVYQVRRDVQRAFPDLFDKDRAAFGDWFVTYAGQEFNLPDAFLDPVHQS